MNKLHKGVFLFEIKYMMINLQIFKRIITNIVT